MKFSLEGDPAEKVMSSKNDSKVNSFACIAVKKNGKSRKTKNPRKGQNLTLRAYAWGRVEGIVGNSRTYV